MTTTTAPPQRRPPPTIRELAHEVAAVAADIPRFATAPLYRRWHQRWGATDQEIAAPMPGDDLIDNVAFLATRAITIDAPPDAVWPWLVQVGCLRAGFYADDLLDNLGHPSARTHPARVSAARARAVGADVADTDGHDRVQSCRVRGQPMAAVAPAAEHMVLDTHRTAWAPDPADHSDTRPPGLAPPRRLDVVRRADGVRRLPDDAPHAARHSRPRRARERPTTTRWLTSRPRDEPRCTQPEAPMKHQTLAAAGLAGAIAGYAELQWLGRTYGATREERHRRLPGDDVCADPHAVTTHAVTIDASPERVWPWLVQMGWGRGQWYTSRWVDRLLFPDNGPSAERLVPEWQHLKVGDRVLDGAPDKNCAFVVAELEPNRHLVLHSREHLPPQWQKRYGAAIDWSWAVRPRRTPSTPHTISRSAVDYASNRAGSRRSTSPSSSLPTSSCPGRCCTASNNARNAQRATTSPRSPAATGVDKPRRSPSERAALKCSTSRCGTSPSSARRLPSPRAGVQRSSNRPPRAPSPTSLPR